ncbi:CRIB domain-containing protein RIC4 [Ziziphus jujuba]|uniref:CRIB domain-containing protein RIC4 n=1 Tax=Ziziphus jujuba TaxID=326968 RepID=A0ABM3IRA6_ZIZJJ|nr:CRIB domain-containing protein RIC4 [Ziziphus jujuba]
MKDHTVERFVILPFAIGCSSDSSIALRTKNGIKAKKTKSEPNPPLIRTREKEETSSSKLVKVKNSFSFLALPKPNISNGMHRLIRSIKSFSQLFVYKEEIEEIEKEIDIGFPTDVKHVTHIGLDGSATTNPIRGWENLNAPELLSFPSISFKQFELAMAAQSQQPLVVDLQS